jgi:chromate reductase, NAD(P)H dehydrogenase (quinone)
VKKILLFVCFIIAAMVPLSAQVKVLAFAGSTRADSYNGKLVADAAQNARQMGASVTLINLKDYPMPLYDADLEAKQGMPKNAKRLRELMINNDAIIIASPEYNGSIPAVLKNALDWASRGEGGNASRSAFKGKKFAIMSASPGPGGGCRGLTHLRSVIEAVGGTVIPKQVCVAQADKYFSTKDRPEYPALKEEIQQLLQPSE